MTKRWTQRPEGSTWGDWGDDDELGRINLITPEKVLQGVAEVQTGETFCLSLPLDFPGGTALNQRRRPPRLAPTEDLEGNPEAFFNIHMSDMDPRYVDVWADDDVTLSLQYSTQWDSLAHVGAEFDVDGDGVEKPVYYNGYRAHEDIVGPRPDAADDGCGHTSFGKHLGLEHMAYHGVQGRGVLVDIAHHVGHEWRGIDLETLQEIMDADNVVVEPGDMLLLHTGFATEILGWNKISTRARSSPRARYLDAHDDALLDWIVDSQISALIADNYAVEGLVARTRTGPRTALVPADPPPLPVQARRPARRDSGTSHELATWLREHDRSRFLLTAPPLRLPGAMGSPLTPVATV